MPSLNWAGYVSASGCHQYGPAGPQAYTTFSEDVFAVLHRSLGICSCRPVRGGSSYSHHAECRAADSGFVQITGKTFAYDYAVLLGEHGARVGIDHIITNRQPWAAGRGEPIIFSAKNPSGRTYTGAHPHKDHNHTGFTRGSAANLTYATLVDVYGQPAQVAAKLSEGDDMQLPAERRADLQAMIDKGWIAADINYYFPVPGEPSADLPDEVWMNVAVAGIGGAARTGGIGDHDHPEYVTNVTVER